MLCQVKDSQYHKFNSLSVHEIFILSCVKVVVTNSMVKKGY